MAKERAISRKGKKKAAAASRRKSQAPKGTVTRKRWSAHVNQTSDALDLEEGIFKSGDPEKIARSLKHSAEVSRRRKGTPYQSAMSMLNFYINRAGKNLTRKEKEPLEKAKDALRKLFGKEEGE